MGNLVDKDKVINLVHEVILEFMSVEDSFTEQDKVLLKINKKICEGIKALDPQEDETDWWVPQIIPHDRGDVID